VFYRVEVVFLQLVDIFPMTYRGDPPDRP
jgi:hypothetical protein